MNVVLTVPHSICLDDNKSHFCDSSAYKNAYNLHNIIRELSPDTKTQLFKSDTYRKICDENRAKCRDKPFRQLIDKNIDSNTVLLDIHSFPKYGFGSIDHDVVLLYLYSLDSNTYNLMKHLQQKGVTVGSFKGTIDNDILYTTRKKVKYNLLIEFNESLSLEEANVICCIIAEWLLDL